MVKHAWLPALSLASLFCIAQAATSAEPGAKPQKSKPAAVSAASASASEVTAAPESPGPAAAPKVSRASKVPSKPDAKPSLGDGIIAQHTLRIYLTRPATVTVHNARGQLLFHVDTSRPAESLPLSGLHAGFLYLTIRSGPLESTHKLVYSGK